MKKIIIIEDEKMLLELLKEKLVQDGYHVVTAQDGQEGLDKIKLEIPDLILLDIVMPKKSGFEVMEELNQDNKLKSIPVIVISNSGQSVELDRIKELGAIDWLIKTDFNPQEVVNKIKKHLK